MLCLEEKRGVEGVGIVFFEDFSFDGDGVGEFAVGVEVGRVTSLK